MNLIQEIDGIFIEILVKIQVLKIFFFEKWLNNGFFVEKIKKVENYACIMI